MSDTSEARSAPGVSSGSGMGADSKASEIDMGSAMSRPAAPEMRPSQPSQSSAMAAMPAAVAEVKDTSMSAAARITEDRREILPSEDKGAVGEGGDGDGDAKRSARPTTARRRPPKVKDGASELQSKDIAPVATKKAEGIIVDGANDEVSVKRSQHGEREFACGVYRLALAYGVVWSNGSG